MGAGLLGAKIMRMALVKRLTLTDITCQAIGKTERKQVSFDAEIFRLPCEQVAVHWWKMSRGALDPGTAGAR
jgi:hypothetical protein